MGDTTPNPDFVQQFCSLKGNLVGERKKNFSTILRSVSEAGQVEVFLDRLAPKNYLESLLRLDALIYFRKTRQMLELLRQGNEVFISKILKQKWFVRDAFREYSAEYLVNEFLPCLSYAVRKKFIKSLMQTIEDQQRVDKVFAAYYERYGLSLASNLLHLCSDDKIKSILEREEVKLQPNQVKHLFNKKPDSFKRYLIYYNDTFGLRYEERKVTEYIANKNPKMLLDLLEDCQLNCSRLGRRQSKRIFGLVQNDIINDFHKYNHLLTSSVLVKRLGENFAKVYYKIFPKSIDDLNFSGEHFTLLKHYPRSKRWQVFYDTSTRKLSSLADLENVLGQLKDEQELQLLTPGNEIIWKWAEVQYNTSGQDRYLKFYPTAKSVPIIREKINVTSDISKRKSLVMLLLETCAYNKDLDALERVMKYIGYRHKNELTTFLYQILQMVARNFNFKDFTESLWEIINDQLKMLRVKKEFSLWRYLVYSKAYIKFLFLNNKDHSEALKKFINDVITEEYFYRWNLEDPELERKILVETIKVAVPIIESHEKALFHKDRLVDTIDSFNMQYPEHCIKLSFIPELYQIVLLPFESNGPYDDLQRNMIRVFLHQRTIFPDSFESIDDDRIIQVIQQSVLECWYFYLLDYFEYMILKKNRSSFEETLVNTFFEVIFSKFPEMRIVDWFLKHEPEKVTLWYPKIINALHGIDGTVDCKIVKCLSHFDYDTQLCELLKLKLASEVHDHKASFMTILRRLLPTDEYIALVKQYFLPEKEKLDLTDEKMMALYHVQCKVCLHRVEEPYKMLPVVMKFAIGDYLQSSLPGLYGVFINSPEKLLPKYLDDLSKRALSARKHAVFLTCELLDQKSVVAALTGTKHEQVSSQKYLFSATLKYFQRNPLPEVLDLLMANMSTIDKHDTEGLKSLLAANVLKKYMALYLERCWRFYESLKESQVKITVYLNGILDKILSSDTLLLELSSSFVREIVQNYFIERREDLQRIIDFTVAVLQKRITNREENFELTFRRVPTLTRRERRDFFKSLTNTESLSTEVKTLIQLHWNQHFSAIDSFWEHIYLKLYLGDGSAGHTIEVLDGILDEFGLIAFQVFQDVFWHYMSIRYQHSREKLRLCQELLQQRDSDTVCLLALHGAGIYREDDETKNIAREIFEAAKEIERPIVRAYCDKYLMESE